jgi:hypothetical protein
MYFQCSCRHLLYVRLYNVFNDVFSTIRLPATQNNKVTVNDEYVVWRIKEKKRKHQLKRAISGKEPNLGPPAYDAGVRRSTVFI